MNSVPQPDNDSWSIERIGRRDLLRISSLLAVGGVTGLVSAQVARAETSATPTGTVVTTYKGNSPYGFDQWASIDFDVPAGVRRITVTYSFEPSSPSPIPIPPLPGTWGNVLDIGLTGPAGFRGWSGSARRELTVSASDATPGYAPGAVEPGRWAVLLGPIVGDQDGMDWEVTVSLESGDPLPALPPYQILPKSITGRGAGWYRGDLHLHSFHSDGGRTLDEIVAGAVTNGLHFIATSEHNNFSAGVSWRGNVPTNLLVINAEEVTTRHGHWLALGLPQGTWIDWRHAPADGTFNSHANRVRGYGGMVVAAHPMTPATGSFFEFGWDQVDAVEIWNGPWTGDDELNVIAWHAVLCSGRKLPGLGNSDAHSPSDAIGTPHNVVNSRSLAQRDVFEAMRQGRCYAAETSAVTVNFTASANGRTVGPGEELPLGVFDSVDVTADISGAPNTVALLYTQWGIMASVSIGGSGTARLTWRGWGKASFFARLEVRRLQPAWTVLTQMVAVTNPIWFYSATPVNQPAPVRTPGMVSPEVPFYGAGIGVRPLPGFDGATSFTGTNAAIAGNLAIAVGKDHCAYTTSAQAISRVWKSWKRLPGPNGETDFRVREVAAAQISGWPNTTLLLATALDGTLYQTVGQWSALTQYSALTPVPGPAGAERWAVTKIAAANANNNSVHVLAYGLDGTMRLNTRNSDGSWSGWTQPQGFGSAPTFAGSDLAITSRRDGGCEIAAIGTDGLVYHQVRQASGQSTGFVRVKGVNAPTMGAVSVALKSNGDTTYLAAVRPDGTVWVTHRDLDAAWEPWEQAILTTTRPVGKVLLFPSGSSVQVMAFTAG